MEDFLRDRMKHSSPNSAQTESACAGALKVSLSGDNYYFGRLVHKPQIGDSIRELEIEDIKEVIFIVHHRIYCDYYCAHYKKCSDVLFLLIRRKVIIYGKTDTWR